MDELPEEYLIETLEQMRGVADELRMRIMGVLSHQALTATQLAERLKEAPAKIHYHVRELERLKLVKLVETREKGGILEKYYRSVAKSIRISGTLLQTLAPDETTEAFNESFQAIFQGFMRAMRYVLKHAEEPHKLLTYEVDHYWMTDDEQEEVSRQFTDILRPYEQHRGIDGEIERTLASISYNTQQGRPTPEEQVMVTPPTPPQVMVTPPTPPQVMVTPPTPPVAPKIHHMAIAGAFDLSRASLERHVAIGEQLHITVLGYCRFEKDITADLIERGVARFRCIGKLDATPEVRAALRLKEAGGTTSDDAANS